MTSEPNRHVICFTIKDVSPRQTYGGRVWEGQDDAVICGTLSEANASLAEKIAQDAMPVAPGRFRILERSNHHLHSWHEREEPLDVAFNVDPLGRILRDNEGQW